MDLQSAWLAPNVLKVVIQGDVYYQDVQEVARHILQRLDEASEPVYIIGVTADIAHLELRFKEYVELFKPYYQHRNYGMAQMVTTNPIHRLFSSVASRFSGAKWRACASVEEALAYIEKLEQVPKS